MKKVISILNEHGGYARMKDFKAASVQTREIYLLTQHGIITKIKPGLYRLANLPEKAGIPICFKDVCTAMPNSVICLLSALQFHKLTTINPSEIFVALPHSAKPPKIEYPPIRVFYFRDRFYSCGIRTVVVENAIIRIYDHEKTICDMFRYRKKLGEETCLKALRNYLKSGETDIIKLYKYAVKCQVKTTMIPYLKAMIAA